MIISGGINVLPGQVEETIMSHPAISECVVIGLEHEKWGQQITAYMIKRAEVNEDEITRHVDNSSLSSYKKPRAYHFVDELPQGNTGKVSRRLLREQLTKEHKQQ